MVKRCQWGLCNTDDRYPERLKDGVKFIPFPKPKRKLEKCKRWIKLCGRPHDQLNVSIADGNKHLYVCTKHFVEGEPTEKYPDPLPAISTPLDARQRPARKAPNRSYEPPKKSRKILFDISSHENVSEDINIEAVSENDTDTNSCKQQPDETSKDKECSSTVTPLDMLALAAENEQLKQQIASLVLENEHLRRKKFEASNSKSSVPRKAFSVKEIRQSAVKDLFSYYTGFTYEKFMSIYRFLVKNDNQVPFKPTTPVNSIKDMPLEDQLLLTLVKVRQNFDNKHLAHLFMISPQDVSVIFTSWINFMFFEFSTVPIWPHRDVIIEHMPTKFKVDFPNTMIILDGTEMKIQRPTSLTTQSQCYSDYKSATTVKGLVGIDPRGSITFISMLYSGSISDKEISAECGLFDTLKDMLDNGMLKEGDGVMVDKGFNIQEEIQTLGLELIVPPNAPSEGQMSAPDVSVTKKIAAHRVHVERAISRVKKFKILCHKIDLSLFANLSQIWYVCCFLTNFMPYLINDS